MTTIEDWSCALCKEILYEPLTLPCGHTVCRVCCYMWFLARTHEKVCPICRAKCVRIVPQIAPVNVMVNNFVKETFPEAYAQRAIECTAIKATWPDPLFIYFSTHYILPFQEVTVTFTEKRYVSMVERAKTFLLLPPAQIKRGDIGIVIAIEEMTMTDGKAVCRVRAVRRCKVMDCWLTDQIEGMHHAQIEPFEDIPVTSPEAGMKKVAKYIEEADKASDGVFTGRAGMPPTNPTELSWWVFKALSFDGCGMQARVPVALTNAILHSRGPLWRLEIAVKLMQQLIEKLKEHRAVPATVLLDQEGGELMPGAREAVLNQLQAAVQRLGENIVHQCITPHCTNPRALYLVQCQVCHLSNQYRDALERNNFIPNAKQNQSKQNE